MVLKLSTLKFKFMIFILGVIVGILLVLALMLLELHSKIVYRPSKLLDVIQTSRKGAIIEPLDETTLSIQEKLRRNREQGIDTRLEDL